MPALARFSWKTQLLLKVLVALVIKELLAVLHRSLKVLRRPRLLASLGGAAQVSQGAGKPRWWRNRRRVGAPDASAHRRPSVPSLSAVEGRGGRRRSSGLNLISAALQEGLLGREELNSGSESELSEDEWRPLAFSRLEQRRGAVSADAVRWSANFVPSGNDGPKKTAEEFQALCDALLQCPFFQDVEDPDTLADSMPIEEHAEGDWIFRQGDPGDSAFVVLSGSVECWEEGEIPVGHEASSPSDSTGGSPRLDRFIRTVPVGRIFGELSMLWSKPRSLSVYAREACVVGRLKRVDYLNKVVHESIRRRQQREEVLRKVKALETLNDEQIAQIADVLEHRCYEKDDVIIQQGEPGDEFFVVLRGECCATVETGTIFKDFQEHMRYGPGGLFGERALLKSVLRAATIQALTPVEALCLSRRKFERTLGPLAQLQEMNYNMDPRKQMADFYRVGGDSGPAGVSKPCDRRTSGIWDLLPWATAPPRTEWFAVYRPTSRDAIAKMLSGEAVGKGLNVKGKSSKKNTLSGFVPFLQISDDSHKQNIEAPEPSRRFQIFFACEVQRQHALQRLLPLLPAPAGDGCRGGTPATEPGPEARIDLIDNFVSDRPPRFGIEVPEPAMRKAWMDEQPLAHPAGWETGRKSEPAFQDMNLHALRESAMPKVVLYQADLSNAMNPHGLLIAYAEDSVKPVVSDFDTFLVGSKGMVYDQLPPEQQRLATWSLDRAEGILNESELPGSWTTRWLEVLKGASQDGISLKFPEFGFGDGTSYKLIEEVVHATRSTGAVRHGAECFNFTFPQELDESYLIVWEKFPDLPWEYKNEDELREFLLERVEEGYSFPVNPIWPVRDPGWYDILEALKRNPMTCKPLMSWFPPSSGILEKITVLHDQFPDGFMPGSYGDSHSVAYWGAPQTPRRSLSFLDLTHQEKADIAYVQAMSSVAKVRSAVNDSLLPEIRKAILPERRRTRFTSAREASRSPPRTPLETDDLLHRAQRSRMFSTEAIRKERSAPAASRGRSPQLGPRRRTAPQALGRGPAETRVRFQVPQAQDEPSEPSEERGIVRGYNNHIYEEPPEQCDLGQCSSSWSCGRLHSPQAQDEPSEPSEPSEERQVCRRRATTRAGPKKKNSVPEETSSVEEVSTSSDEA